MGTRTVVRRTLVAAGLSTMILGLTAGVAEAKPRQCGALQHRFDRIMANVEANGANWAPIEWEVVRQALASTSDQMDALGC